MLTALLGGCGMTAADSYCDIAAPIVFDSQRTVNWLLANDRALLVDVVTHNETNARLCG